jgi:hypothetical protein
VPIGSASRFRTSKLSWEPGIQDKPRKAEWERASGQGDPHSMSIRAAGGASGSGDPGLPREAQQDRVASAIYRLVFASGLLLGVWVGWSALRMTYYTRSGNW